jgi:2-oxoglutarate dehydrogenase E2 component (dihydrolipoamide succinyltransferase)
MGSGQDGRVTKADILNYLPNRNKPSSITTKSENNTTSSFNSSQNNFTINRPTVSVGAEDEVIEMDRMRKIIAENMVMSKHVAPHVTSYVEADVTNLVLWRDKAKKEFEKRDGEKLTFTPIFIEAVAKGKDRIMLVMATGTGKSGVALGDANGYGLKFEGMEVEDFFVVSSTVASALETVGV